MLKTTINEIEIALKLHISYKGVSSGNRYLQIMDRLACQYTGTLSEKVSKLLDDYFKEVKVNNLDEALQRLREQENAGK